MNLITPMEIHTTPEEYEERQRVRRLWKKKIADGEARPGDDAIQAASVQKSNQAYCFSINLGRDGRRSKKPDL